MRNLRLKAIAVVPIPAEYDGCEETIADVDREEPWVLLALTDNGVLVHGRWDRGQAWRWERIEGPTVEDLELDAEEGPP